MLRKKLSSTAMSMGLSSLALLIMIPGAQAAYLNMGTLDVAPVAKTGAINQEWFVEYLHPNESVQEQIRVSNFSSEEKHLTLSVQNADATEGQNFFVQSPEESTNEGATNIANWVKLPADKLVLKPGESKILSANFRIPAQAGVGLHTGAIIVSEDIDNPQIPEQIVVQKGVRIYLNVVGVAITKANPTGLELKDAGGNIEVVLGMTNSGTTDYQQNFSVGTYSLWGENIENVQQKISLTPGQTKNTITSIAKPAFGLYKIKVDSELGTYTSGPMIAVPLWALLAVVIVSFGIIRVKAKALSPQKAGTARGLQKVSHTAWSLIQRKELQKSFAFFGVFIMIATITFSFTKVDTQVLKAQLLDSKNISSFRVTIKWGNVRNLVLPPTYKKKWSGRISSGNSKIHIEELQNFESTDRTEITNDNSILSFQNETGPDNDGIVLRIEPLNNEIPILTYENNLNKQRNELRLSDFLDSEVVIPDTLFGTSFKAQIGPENDLAALTIEANPTAEIQATSEPRSNTPTLGNLFQELPATADQLADVIFSSDYVEKISEENGVRRIDTDPILIQALSGSPEILEEITPTQDLNFLFVPHQTINFPTQTFSFRDEKIAVESLGTLIFVQNKKTPWNTYISSSNFISLSGKGIIPAGALSIDPGEPKLLTKKSEDIVVPGSKHTLDGSFDKAILVSVQPSEDSRTIFALQPTFELRIPPKTIPGRYRAKLTITNL